MAAIRCRCPGPAFGGLGRNELSQPLIAEHRTPPAHNEIERKSEAATNRPPYPPLPPPIFIFDH